MQAHTSYFAITCRANTTDEVKSRFTAATCFTRGDISTRLQQSTMIRRYYREPPPQIVAGESWYPFLRSLTS